MSARRSGILLLFVVFSPQPFICSINQAAERDPRADRPNVLFIAIDDLNDWVGCLGGCPGRVDTPYIDSLARRGMLFTNAHCAAPVCNPSRTAVMTGLRPSTSGVYNNGHWWRPALPDVVTLPEYFARHGYRVEGGGKIFHHTPGFNPPEQWRTYFDQEFDDAWHRPPPGAALPVRTLNWPTGFPLNRIANVVEGRRPPANPLEFDWGPFNKPDAEMGDGQMVEWAVDFLSREQDAPFFLAAGIFRPHLPWYAPAAYFDQYPLGDIRLPEVPDDDLDDLPDAGVEMGRYRGDEWRLLRDRGRWTDAVQAYLASISFADALVGRLIMELGQSRYADNTIIVLWSDHGWHLGEKHHWHKFTLWEEATRVPLIVVTPGMTAAGHCAQPVSLIDLYPTLIDLCDLPPHDELDGRSLMPLLTDPESDWERPAVVTTHGPNNHAARTRDFRYIRYADGAEELYDHRTDPDEWTNLAARTELHELKQRLSRLLPAVNATPVPGKNHWVFDTESYTWKPRND